MVARPVVGDKFRPNHERRNVRLLYIIHGWIGREEGRPGVVELFECPLDLPGIELMGVHMIFCCFISVTTTVIVVAAAAAATAAA